MLLIHQTGSVNIGQIARYTVTYNPSLDRILPPPSHLHVKIKNTSAIPLRAAYLHGPYTLYVATYPSTFNPNKKHTTAREEGEPDYEPQLKAGGYWSAKLTVPESIRQDAQLDEREEGVPSKSFTWIIEIASQVLFSTTASVHYELLVGRDEKSVSLGFTGVVSSSGAPGRLEDHQLGKRSNTQPRGVFTKAVSLRVDDTRSLWNSPAFPSHEETNVDTHEPVRVEEKESKHDGQRPRKKRKKVHLVILTHGLHSNLGADMLYMKESIEATARQAREDAKNAKHAAHEEKAQVQNDFGRQAMNQRAKSAPDLFVAPVPSFDPTENIERPDADEADENDAEEVVVKGFNGNAVRTERGIQYLGKRLAKFVLSITYPDQPYLPVKSTITQSISRTFTGAPKPNQKDGRRPSHKGSSIAKDENHTRHDLPYQITSISFIGHSLGGLIQTYAIAYIQKHSPEFFDRIKPINFVAMASPFLGLSNENPMYVKFALDFGLVGRTGQDLGLTWRAPTIARNGWGAMVGGFSDNAKSKETNPGAKPLLRILPTGPAHVVLKRFRNRSVYSNVVNDGIVPLRTSCLLFLDWRGLGRVEKARRENGLVGTMVNWGLSEMLGQNVSAPRKGFFEDLFSDSGDEAKLPNRKSTDPGSAVPQADAGAGFDDTRSYQTEDKDISRQDQPPKTSQSSDQNINFWSTVTSFFRPQGGSQKQAAQKPAPPKQRRIYERGQTTNQDDAASDDFQRRESLASDTDHRKLLVRGSSLYTNSSDNDNLDAPPRTTVFESAGDLLNPPLPPKEFLLDPEARPRTIFHDRVYHPEDIPPPPTKRQKVLMRSRPTTSENSDLPKQDHEESSKNSNSATSTEEGTMRIEEKIARAYHKDMTWRKVLVRLEPDAHNNIIVRRMFANAYGWPVVKHLCDTHFAYTAAARTADEDEAPVERAKAQDKPVSKDGEEVEDQTQKPERHEAKGDKKTASAEDLPNKEAAEVDTMHQRQKNLQVHGGTARTYADVQKTQARDARSPSELRESRDQVSDLVAMVSAQGEPSLSYSSMHSGTAALHRLARQDSARWSDRFFDSDGDEDEDEDPENVLNTEWQNAYNRGQGRLGPPSSSPNSTRSGHASHGASGDGGSVGGGSLPPKLDPKSRLVAEPESISRRSSQRSMESITEEPVPLDGQALSLTGVGLERNVQSIAQEVHVAGRKQPASPTSGGIFEQVARVHSQGTESSPAADDDPEPKKDLH